VLSMRELLVADACQWQPQLGDTHRDYSNTQREPGKDIILAWLTTEWLNYICIEFMKIVFALHLEHFSLWYTADV